jgi:predicted glycogen debranching enzyme
MTGDGKKLSRKRVSIVMGRDITGNWETASRKEWLVTNGLGGFAAGTVAGANTRRYHGILVVALNPPVERLVVVAKLEVSVTHLGRRYDLSANEFDGGAVEPKGFVHIESFRLEEGIPTWRYAFADVLLDQRIFMKQGYNTTHITLHAVRASAPVSVSLTPLCTYRDYHSHSRGRRPLVVTSGMDCCVIEAFKGARVVRLGLENGTFEEEATWYWNFFHRRESERGLDTSEDLFSPGRFTATLQEHERLTFEATVEAAANSGSRPSGRVGTVTACVAPSLPPTAPPWIHQLARAADQFIVSRGNGAIAGRSVIAGYPWFTDWGRDTMIALPGLTSALGRHAEAAEVLRTFARFVDGGMLPNRFPDRGETPEYNTVDATLWFFQAIRSATLYANDDSLAVELYPTLIDIVAHHVAGTRYGIKVDSDDALLRAGVPGTQLTWMDAKVGEWVVTPRVGKPVEVNALWLNALHFTIAVAEKRRDKAGRKLCADLLAHGSVSFEKFWNEDAGGLYDVIDVDHAPGNDVSLRPNQLFAVSLPYRPLAMNRMQRIVMVCARELLTSYGLRSLGRNHPSYRGRYEGDSRQRDGAYHQGTVWSWLLGPFALAHFHVNGDPAAAQSYLEAIAPHLQDACVGSVSEIFDGDPPHVARGCVAQAWSVAEILRCWTHLEALRLANGQK